MGGIGREVGRLWVLFGASAGTGKDTVMRERAGRGEIRERESEPAVTVKL